MAQLTPLQHLQSFLSKHPNIKKIRCHAITYGNVSLTRFLTVARALEMAALPPTEGGSISCGSSGLRMFAATGHYDLYVQQSQDDLWLPDFATLKLCAASSDHACCMVNVIEPQAIEMGKPWQMDPRAILCRTQQAAAEKGYSFLMGAEVEFYFLTNPSADAVVQTADFPLYNTQATRHALFKVVDEAVDVLEEHGIGVWGFHFEGGSSTYEISLRPADPLTAMDNLAFAHHVIKDLANKHGYFATMHPQAFAHKWPTVGQHLHVSVSKDGANPGDAFLAGLLEHLPSMAAFLLAGYDSYAKGRKLWYGSGPVMWGTGKGTPIRRRGDSHFELRLGDAMGNPFFQAAAIVSAGMDGVERQLELTSKPAPGYLMEEAISEDEMKKLGVTQMLPESLQEAVEVLKADDRKWMGDLSGALDGYIRFEEMEAKNSEAMDVDERRKAILRHI